MAVCLSITAWVLSTGFIIMKFCIHVVRDTDKDSLSASRRNIEGKKLST